MQITHFKSDTVADATGTVTGWYGTSTVTVAATDLVRPSDWNSNHALALTVTGNTTVGSTVSGSVIPFAGSGNVSLGVSNGTLIFSGGGGAGGVTLNYFNPQDGYVQVTGQQGQGSMHVQPMQAPPVTFDRVAFPVNLTHSSNSTGSVTLSLQMGIYTRNDSTLSLLMSTSTTVGATYSGNNANSSTFAGLRLLTMPWSTSLDEGQYYVGIHSRTTSANNNATFNQILASQQNSNFSGLFGAASNASVQYTRGLGHFSTTFSTAVPNSVALSDIRGTASIVLRQPVFYFVNGTF